MSDEANREIIRKAFKECYDNRMRDLHHDLETQKKLAIMTGDFEVLQRCVQKYEEISDKIETVRDLWRDTSLGVYDSERHVVWLINELCGYEPIKLSEEES